jgi:hypothetical protein
LNGIHYELGSAVIRVNGEVATEQDLALGQVVMVDAYVDAQGSAIADSVDFESILRGQIQSIDLDAGVLVVLEQRVRVSPDTILDFAPGNNISVLSVGDMLEVSGLWRSERTINATRIADAAPDAELRIAGRVDDLNQGKLRFEIGSLEVDYRNAGLIEGFPTGQPREGDEVLVVGDQLRGNGTLVASRLEFIRTGLGGREGHEAEVEGLITRFVTPADFDVAGVPATATGSTRYEGGSAGDLELDLKIQIEGRIDSDGTIVAEKIEIKD